MKNAVMGSRLDGDLEGAQRDCASLHGECRDAHGVIISNNNHEIESNKTPSTNNNDKNTLENTSVGNRNNSNSNNSISSNITAQGPKDVGSEGGESNISSSIVEESIGSQEVKFEKPIIIDTYDEIKLTSAAGSPVDKRSSSSEESVSPIEKNNSSAIKKGPPHYIDCNRTSQSNEKKIGSPNRSRNKKNLRPWIATDKTRLESSGSVDSKSDSVSPDRCDRHHVFQRDEFENLNSEKMRLILMKRDSVCSPKESNTHDMNEDPIGGNVRVDEDNEPPAPAPGSRPVSPDRLGLDDTMVASRLSSLHVGPPAELVGARRLRLENERLVAEVARLRRLVLSGAAQGEVGGDDAAVEEETRFVALEMELQHSREVIQVLKTDRKRFKAEKFDLLNQMKALYSTLEDKEKELRDFIRNYEQRMRENEVTLGCLQPGAGLSIEERERERWSLLRAARDEADRSLSLAASLADREAALSHAHATIKDLQRQLGDRGSTSGICLSDQESLISFSRSNANDTATPALILPHLSSQTPLCMTDIYVSGVIGSGVSSTSQTNDRGSCSADSGVRGSSDRESGGATSVGGNLSDSTTDATTPKDCSPTLSPSNAFSRSMDTSSMSRSVEQLSSSLDTEGRRNKQPTPVTAPTAHARSSATRGGPWGSISRVFARSRHRKMMSNSVSNASKDASGSFDTYRSWSPMTEDGYAEKLRLLREANTIPMERWRATTILAWLEVALGMPQYSTCCAENIKSGKVLLELNDTELEAGLGITHPLHKKKLRLAIEEHRHPNLLRYPNIAQLGHTWVSSEWLPDLGLAQYAESFATNMVDARMLDHVMKKELEKLLGVTRKFHQASIMHGINLLRMLQYDRQALALRRRQSEQVDEDPLVWTNLRFIKWARNIDLSEYADNLKDSGVHGALVVLEPSFTGDTMATALGIPPAKHMIRRHLTAELEALVLPARSQLEVIPRNHIGGNRPLSTVSAGGSLGRGNRTPHLQHHQNSLSALHMTAANTANTNDRRRLSLRGSLSRAFGFRPRNEKASPSSLSDTGSFMSHCQYLSSIRNSPSPPQLPPRPTANGEGNDNVKIGSGKRHRRVKSIGDIEYISNGPANTSV